MYFWLSLFELVNSSITSCSFWFCLVISIISFSSFAFSSSSFALDFSEFTCSSFWLFILSWKFCIFSSIDCNFCFSVAYVISISCNCFDKFSVSSNISSDEFSYSCLSFSIFSILFFIFSISCFNCSISLLLPRIFTVFFAIEPPVIEPDTFIISPSNVIILNVLLFSFDKLIAFCILSTITVLPSKFNIICSYFLSKLIKSEAIPITPTFLPFIASSFFPFTELIGKNDALPKLLALKYSINFFASCSVSVTIFCKLAPNAISIAVSYSFGTAIKFAITPYIPLFNSWSFSQSNNNCFTLFIYPSFSFSVSTKKLCLEVFILNSFVKLFICSSNCFNFVVISSLCFSLFSNSFKTLFLLFSIILNSFSISSFFIFILSISNICDDISCFNCFCLLS